MWVNRLEPEFLESVREVFADAPEVLKALHEDTAESFERFPEAMKASIPDSATLEAFRELVFQSNFGEHVPEAQLAEAKKALARQEELEEWIGEYEWRAAIHVEVAEKTPA